MKDLPSIFLEACSGANIKSTDVFYTSFESLGCLFLDTVTFVFKEGNVLKIMRKENRRYRPSIRILIVAMKGLFVYFKQFGVSSLLY